MTAWQESDEERAFVRAIADDPDDEATRLVYADWLDERSDPRGELLRLEVGLTRLSRNHPQFARLNADFEEAVQLAKLSTPLVGEWCDVVFGSRQGRIAACGQYKRRELTFAFRCPNRWESLEPTADPTVRHCAGCRQNVHYCVTDEQAHYHAEAGRCVALSSRLVVELDAALERTDDLSVTTGIIAYEGAEPNGGETLRTASRRWWQFWK